MKQLILKNSQLIDNELIGLKSVYTWLAQQKLHGKASRERTRFLKLLEPRVLEIQSERKKMNETFAEKDKDGKVLFLDKSGKITTESKDAVRYHVLESNQEKFNKALREYFDEELVIDITPERRASLDAVKDVILNTEEAFEGATASLYDEWCTAFEDLRVVEGEKSEKA